MNTIFDKSVLFKIIKDNLEDKKENLFKLKMNYLKDEVKYQNKVEEVKNSKQINNKEIKEWQVCLKGWEDNFADIDLIEGAKATINMFKCGIKGDFYYLKFKLNELKSEWQHYIMCCFFNENHFLFMYKSKIRELIYDINTSYYLIKNLEYCIKFNLYKIEGAQKLFVKYGYDK